MNKTKRYIPSHAGELNNFEHLDRRILRKLIVGNRVRLLMYAGYEFTVFVTITKICGKGKYKGIVNDPFYNNPVFGLPFKNGDKVSFSRSNICEIRLEKCWKENKNLAKTPEAF